MDQPKNKSMKSLTDPIIAMVPTRVKLGYGSFLTFDFGKDRIQEKEKLHHHVSGWDYSFLELVEEGIELLGKS